MLYAKYKTRNLQGVLGPGGAGSSPATTTGSSNATGGADTKNESSKYVCGLGLEGVFGGICEWVEGVEINNRVWKITDPDGSTRNVNAETFSGWIINIAAENGPFFDVVPTQVGGSDSTHYSDYYSRTSDSSLVLGKSLMWIDHHKGIIEDSKTWGGVVPGLRRVGVGACALASDLLMGKVPVRLRCAE